MSEGKKNVAILLETSYQRPFKIVEGILSVKGVRERCAFRNFMLYSTKREEIFTDDWTPDGIITCYGESETGLEWLANERVPVVNLANTSTRKHASVGNDYESIANTAMEHFLALEVASVLFTKSIQNDSANQIGLCLAERAAEVNIPYHEVGIPEQLSTGEVLQLDRIVEDLGHVIDTLPKPLAIYTFHDQRGRVMVDYVQRRGYRVPEDICLLGCFDSIDARLCDPPLSSIILRDNEVGARGVEMLEEMMRNPQFPQYNLVVPVNGIRMRASTAANKGQDMEVLRARQMIRERSCRGVTVEQIVSELNVSRSTFEKRFTCLTGHSPAQEIREVRLERARELLVTTDLPLAKIAPLVGFMDRRAFMVFFKRESGITPGSYRETHK